MWPYIVMVGVPATISIYDYAKHRRTSFKAIISSFFLIFLLLLIFRADTVGVDVKGYEYLYKYAEKRTFSYAFTNAFSMDYELGFFLLMKLLLFMHADFRVLLIITAVFSIIPLWYLYREEIDNHAFIAIIVFLNIGLFSIYFSALRQIIALSFGVFAYRFTKRKKLLLFLLMVFLAFLFHKSAFILLLMYPIYHVNIKWHYALIGTFVLLPTVYIFRVQIFRFLGNLFSDVYQSEISLTNAVSIFLLLIIFVVFCFVIPDNSLIDKDTIGLRNLLVLCAVLQVFAGVHTLAMRMNYYYLLFVPIILTRCISYTSIKNKRITEVAVLTMITFFTAYYFYGMFFGADALHVYPYIPFWRQS